jgi:transcriptional regulator GlxA family with amidase domain
MNNDFEIMHIVSISQEEKFIEKKQSVQAGCNRMEKVVEYVIANLDEQISLKKIAGIACMTEQSFCRFFKRKTAKKFFEYVEALRMEHAVELLMKPSGNSISHIAYSCGYNYSSHFCRIFKNYYGQSPYRYRATINKLTA